MKAVIFTIAAIMMSQIATTANAQMINKRVPSKLADAKTEKDLDLYLKSIGFTTLQSVGVNVKSCIFDLKNKKFLKLDKNAEACLVKFSGNETNKNYIIEGKAYLSKINEDHNNKVNSNDQTQDSVTSKDNSSKPLSHEEVMKRMRANINNAMSNRIKVEKQKQQPSYQVTAPQSAVSSGAQ